MVDLCLAFRKQCPIRGCLACPSNIHRHLKTVHGINDTGKVIESWEQMKDIGRIDDSSLTAVTESPQSVTKRSKITLTCPVCDAKYKKLDEHLVKLHKVERGTEKHRDFMLRAQTEFKDEHPVQQTIMHEGLEICISVDDSLSQLLNLITSHLKTYDSLSVGTINKYTRFLKNCIEVWTKGKIINVTPTLIKEVLVAVNSEHGYLKTKAATMTYASKRAVIDALMKVTSCLRVTQNRKFRLSREDADEIKLHLLGIRGNYYTVSFEFHLVTVSYYYGVYALIHAALTYNKKFHFFSLFSSSM